MDVLLKYFPEISADPVKQSMYSALEPLYREWNSRINVISRKDVDMLYLHHVLHSLAIFRTGLLKPGQTVMDVGCGGGFPVIPLAVMMPDTEFTAVDSIGKKIKVVDAVIGALGLKNVKTVNARAESVQGKFDWVVSRAVTALPQFVKWTWDKTDRGILYLKGGNLTEEIAETGLPVESFDVYEWFPEEYFLEKKVLFIKKSGF